MIDSDAERSSVKDLECVNVSSLESDREISYDRESDSDRDPLSSRLGDFDSVTERDAEGSWVSDHVGDLDKEGSWEFDHDSVKV